jgi:uncharacterized protein
MTTTTGTIPRRPLGSTGITISMIGIGGYHLAGEHMDARASIALVRRAIDEGIDFLDNSWDYNEGDSERRMGRALAGGYRDRAFLMTKIDGRTRDAAARQIDESLQRLETDRIDLLQFHEIIRPSDPDRIFAPGGAMEAVEDAKAAGKIRFIGSRVTRVRTYTSGCSTRPLVTESDSTRSSYRSTSWTRTSGASRRWSCRVSWWSA